MFSRFRNIFTKPKVERESSEQGVEGQATVAMESDVVVETEKGTQMLDTNTEDGIPADECEEVYTVETEEQVRDSKVTTRALEDPAYGNNHEVMATVVTNSETKTEFPIDSESAKVKNTNQDSQDLMKDFSLEIEELINIKSKGNETSKKEYEKQETKEGNEFKSILETFDPFDTKYNQTFENLTELKLLEEETKETSISLENGNSVKISRNSIEEEQEASMGKEDSAKVMNFAGETNGILTYRGNNNKSNESFIENSPPSSEIIKENSSKVSNLKLLDNQSNIKSNLNNPSQPENCIKPVRNNFSIMLDDLSHNVTSPSTDSGNGGSELNTTTTTTDTSTAADTTVIVTPTGNNVIACNAISSKLKDISEVAESLDSVIREVQEEALLMDTHHTSSARKPKNPARSIDAATENDCFSRSTEDESFVTVSEGNFTPCSHSSSFQTASGRTLSFNASGNSFDEADDCTLNAFEMPETTSLPQEGDVDHNYLGSEQTSPSPTTPPPPTVDGAKCRIIPIEIEDVDSHSIIINDDQSSVVDIEELHSRSVTPSVSEDRPPLQSIPIVECDAAPSCIVDAPSMEILTEVVPLTTSVTPEVSHTCPSASGQLTNTNKPNAAWRRNKYYENITKQTIKGFL